MHHKSKGLAIKGLKKVVRAKPTTNYSDVTDQGS